MSCKGNQAFNTSFNEDGDVPPFTGVFFEVAAIGNGVEIVTLELDVISSLSKNDLAIEVFSVNGSFENVFDEPEAWELVADSKLIPVPDRASAIIPVNDFRTLRIPAHERLSLYITLTVSGLDHNVYGLQKTGDRHIKNDYIQLYVGAGTHEYKFPSNLERSLYPMFAGVVHYRVDQDCNVANPTTSSVAMNFLVDMNAEQFRQYLSTVMTKLHASMLPISQDLAKPFVAAPVTLTFRGKLLWLNGSML